MAINRSFISTQDITQNTSVVIQLVSSRPDVNAFLQTPVEPNILMGYYDPTRGVVELYVTDQAGRRYLRVV